MHKHAGTSKARLLTILSIVFRLLPLNASADIILNDAALRDDMFHDYVLQLTQSIPTGEGLFAIAINDLGNDDFKFSYWSIAEYYSLHAVVSGIAFTPDYVRNDSTPVVGTAGTITGSTINIPVDESILLGYWDDRKAFDRIPTSNDNYGWVELQNTPSGLIISDGATAVGGGIYVGTYSQVPEPSTILLMCSGAALILRYRRKRDNGNSETH
jgi:hypothetical protein